jgi:electron transfer flavoprotein alpha subunit
MLALIPVRDGVLPSGAAETAAECGGRVVIAGRLAHMDPTQLEAFGALGSEVRLVDVESLGPGAWSAALAPLVASETVVVLPASPDGRDLAPRLAHRLGRRLLAGAVSVNPQHITVSRQGGLVLHTYRVDSAVVATLQPGVRGVEPPTGSPSPSPEHLGHAPVPPEVDAGHDAELIEVLAPDVTTMDLGEAPRIIGGGAGLESSERFAQLSRLSAELDAAMGATRVITDRGWVSHERQIGTTGVIVDPQLYLSFGISGAVQHTSGLGNPRHIISVNTDPHCPMMQMSDLAVVSDANQVLEELAAALHIEPVGTRS